MTNPNKEVIGNPALYEIDIVGSSVKHYIVAHKDRVQALFMHRDYTPAMFESASVITIKRLPDAISIDDLTLERLAEDLKKERKKRQTLK